MQEQVFERIKSTLANSALAKHYGIQKCSSIQAFRQQVPVLSYDELSPFIARAMNGERDALFGRHIKLNMFALSSGTTGPRKYIPINNKVVSELKRTWRWWGAHLYSDHPDLIDCPITQITSSGLAGKTSGGIPYGDLSGFLAEIQPWYVSNFYTVPSYASKIANQKLKYYVFLRFALANRDLRIMMTASPATLLRIADLAQEESVSLIRDFYDGGVSLSGSFDIPKIVAQRLSTPDRQTAMFLEGLLNESAFEPRYFWPDLKVLACWTGGTMAHFKPILTDKYGAVIFRDVGLASSEAHATVPIADNCDEGLLNLYSHVYEFEPQDNPGNTCLPHELEKGKTYSLIITSLNGLVRYQTNDQVVCAGHMGHWPLLRFHNKGEYICDLTGEKLSAYHVSKAVERACEETGIRLESFIMMPSQAIPRSYTLFIEEGCAYADWIEANFLPCLDKQLGKENFIYQEHREALKLGPLQLKLLPPRTIQEWHSQRLIKSGGSIEQFKPPCLIDDAKRYDLRVS